MNIYRHRFVSKCPANGEQIVYDLTIESTTMIRIEEIREIVLTHKTGWHEDIADALCRVGGKQTLVAEHDGITIETRRG